MTALLFWDRKKAEEKKQRKEVKAYFQHFFRDLKDNERLDIQVESKVSIGLISRLTPDTPIEEVVEIMNKLRNAEKELMPNKAPEKEIKKSMFSKIKARL